MKKRNVRKKVSSGFRLEAKSPPTTNRFLPSIHERPEYYYFNNNISVKPNTRIKPDLKMKLSLIEMSKRRKLNREKYQSMHENEKKIINKKSFTRKKKTKKRRKKRNRRKTEDCKILAKLVDVPSEIFVIVFEYIPCRCVFLTIKLVCKRFYEIIHSNSVYFKKTLSNCFKRNHSRIINRKRIHYHLHDSLFKLFVLPRSKKGVLMFLLDRPLEDYSLVRITMKKSEEPKLPKIPKSWIQKSSFTIYGIKKPAKKCKSMEVLLTPYRSQLKKLVYKYDLNVLHGSFGGNEEFNAVEITSNKFCELKKYVTRIEVIEENDISPDLCPHVYQMIGQFPDNRNIDYFRCSTCSSIINIKLRRSPLGKQNNTVFYKVEHDKYVRYRDFEEERKELTRRRKEKRKEDIKRDYEKERKNFSEERRRNRKRMREISMLERYGKYQN